MSSMPAPHPTARTPFSLTPPPPLRHPTTPDDKHQTFVSKGESRPRVERIEDELDQWGRPKKAARTPLDALPAEAQAKALQQLEEREGAEAERERLAAEREGRGRA